jgi:hypothetical protein
MSSESRLLPFQPATMTTAQLAAVSFLARYAGHTTSPTPTSCADGSTGAKTTDWTHWSGSNAPTSSCTSAASAQQG